jgi:pimeloyl-ACP methyl ester carboxylesterase
MKKNLKKIIIFVAISITVYFVIAGSLIIIKGNAETTNQEGLRFDELAIDYSALPALDSFSARDDAELYYRYYPSQSDCVLILLHGSGWHSKYFLPLADYISSENIAHVYTPDLRGHGLYTQRRGDIDYIEQLNDDLADFVAIVQQQHPQSKIIIGGHSSGGGLAIRFAGSEYGDLADAYLLLSPFLQYNAPTINQNSNWASPYTPRIIGLSMLNNVGINWFNDLEVISFNMPEEYRDGTETLSYSYRLNTGYAPKNYKKDFERIEQDVLLLVGSADKSNIAEEFEPEISKYKADTDIRILDGVSHMGIVVGEEVRPVIEQWIRGLN